MLSISEASDDATFAALQPKWEALHLQSPGSTPFQSWEWISTWWSHHPRGKRWILVARDGDVAVGILPLVITRYRGSPLRQVRFMGAPLSDFQDAITLPGRAEECAKAFFAHLKGEKGRWDLADLNDLRERTALPLAHLGDEFSVELGLHRRCPVIPLAPSWQEHLASLGRKLRSNVTRRRRNVEKEFRAEFVTADEAILPSAMEDLFRLHNQRWRRRGALGAFSSTRVQRFHRDVARRFLERGWLRLHLLRLDDQVRAASYCFQQGERVYNYLPGFDPAIAKFGPGQLLMAYGIERAIADGAREFDLLRGDESYKYEWKAEDRHTVRMVLSHGGWRSQLARIGHSFERLVEHQGLRLQRRLWDGPAGGRQRKEETATAQPDRSE